MDGKNDPDTFLKKAVKFANEDVFGTLSLNLTISPEAEKSIDLDSYIHQLKWGAIGINVYAAQSNALPTCRWGAYPGAHSPKDIQSGMGEQGNTLLIRKTAKAVVRAPFVEPIALIGPPTSKSPALWAAAGRAALHQTLLKFLMIPKAVFFG